MYQKALELNRLGGFKSNEAIILINIGTVYRDAYNNFEESEKHILAAHAIFLQTKNMRLAQASAVELQNLYLKFGKCEQTIRQGDYVIRLAKDAPDKDFTIRAYDNMARAFAFMGDTASAHDRFRRADSLIEISTGKGVNYSGSIYHQINCDRAMIYAQTGDIASANQYIRNSRKYVDSTKTGSDLQVIRLWQAKALYWAGSYTESVDTLRKAIADTLFDKNYDQLAHLLYGAGLMEIGDEAKGMQILSKYYPLVKKTGWVENQFTAELVMSRAFSKTGRTKEAVTLLNEAKKQAQKVGYYGFIPIFDRELASLEEGI